MGQVRPRQAPPIRPVIPLGVVAKGEGEDVTGGIRGWWAIRLRVEGLVGLVRDLGTIAPDAMRTAA